MAVDPETLDEQIAPSASAAPLDVPFRRISPFQGLAEAWHSRHLLRLLGGEAIHRTFAFTMLGPLWIFLGWDGASPARPSSSAAS